jgi:hypothetical protein
VEKAIATSISNFFNFIVPYKNSNLAQELFFEDLILYIIKGYQPLSYIENVWLRRLALCQCGLVIPSRRQFSNKVILSMVKKTMEHHFFPTLANAIVVRTTFDLWMSQGSFDKFVMVVNYINKKWEPCHVIMGIFGVHETLKVVIIVQLKDLLT